MRTLSELLNRQEKPVPYARSHESNTPAVWGNWDKTADLAAYTGNSTIYSVVSSLANSVAGINWFLERSNSEDVVEDHLALKVLNANKYFTFRRLVETLQQHIELTGEAYWLITYYQGTKVPAMLWPIRPDKIVPVPDPETFIKGYIYVSPDGEQIPLQPDDIIPFIDSDPMNPYRGSSPVKGLRETLDGERLAEIYSRKFFENGAQPGGVVQFPENIVDATRWEQLNQRWKEQHKGLNNAHRVAFLEGGATWQSVQYNNTDMQFIEWRNFNREVILEAWSFPKSMTGNVNDVNRANAEAGEYVYGKHRLVPRLELIKSALNNHYLPLFGSAGKGVQFQYESPVSEDRSAENAERTSKVNSAVQMVNAGFDPEGSLEAMELPPIKFVGKTTEQPPEAVPATGGSDE